MELAMQAGAGRSRKPLLIVVAALVGVAMLAFLYHRNIEEKRHLSNDVSSEREMQVLSNAMEEFFKKNKFYPGSIHRLKEIGYQPKQDYLISIGTVNTKKEHSYVLTFQHHEGTGKTYVWDSSKGGPQK